jgi:hypothetical protein
MPNTTTTLVQQRTSLFPPCLTELFTAANELSLATTATCRTIRKTAEGVERTVDGLNEITTLMLRQQRERLLLELSLA